MCWQATTQAAQPDDAIIQDVIELQPARHALLPLFPVALTLSIMMSSCFTLLSTETYPVPAAVSGDGA